MTPQCKFRIAFLEGDDASVQNQNCFLGRRLRFCAKSKLFSWRAMTPQCKIRIAFLEGDDASVKSKLFSWRAMTLQCKFRIVLLESNDASVQNQNCFRGGRLRHSANSKYLLWKAITLQYKIKIVFLQKFVSFLENFLFFFQRSTFESVRTSTCKFVRCVRSFL